MASAKSPLIDLVEINFARQQDPDVFLASSSRPVVWAGRKYLAAGKLSIRIEQNGGKDRNNDMSISIPGVTRILARAMHSLEMGGVPILVRQVSLASQSRADSVVRFAGRIATCAVQGLSIAISAQPSAVDPNGLHQIPRRSHGVDCGLMFGGPGCGVDRERYTYRGVAGDGSTTQIVFDDGVTSAIAGARWVPCDVLFDTGILTGQSRPVASLKGGQIVLRKPFLSKPAAGDRYRLMRDCLRTIDACDEFDNTPNFGGEPYGPSEPRNLQRDIS